MRSAELCIGQGELLKAVGSGYGFSSGNANRNSPEQPVDRKLNLGETHGLFN